MFVEAAVWIPYFVFYTFKWCFTYSTNKYSILFCLFNSVLFIQFCSVYSILFCLFYSVLFILFCYVYSFLLCLLYSVLFILFCSYLLNCNIAKIMNPFFSRFRNEEWIRNYKWYERKRVYLDWRNSPGICLEWLRKTKKNVRNDDRFSSPNVKADFPNTSRTGGFNNRTQYSRMLY
jgi:hypothetical protein